MISAVSSSSNSAPTYGGFWLRFWAWLFDMSLLGIVASIIARITVFISVITIDAELLKKGIMEGVAIESTIGIILLGIVAGALETFLLTTIVGWLYYALSESLPRQATLGKMLLGLHVMNTASERISFFRATLRYFMKSLSVVPLFVCLLLAFWHVSGIIQFELISILFIPIFIIISFGMAGLTSKKQALHDMIAGTYAIRERRINSVVLAFIIIGIIIVAQIAHTTISFNKTNNAPPQATSGSGQTTDTPNHDRERTAYPQLHVVGVEKGLPADGVEAPVWWQKCINEGIDPGSAVCYGKYADVQEQGVVNVKVTRTGGPLILAFMASEPTTWKMSVQTGVTIEKIILGGSAAQKIEGKPSTVPLSIYTSDPSPCNDCYQGDGYFYGYEEDGNLLEAFQRLREITGKTPLSFQGRSQGDSFVISDTTANWAPTNAFMR